MIEMSGELTAKANGIELCDHTLATAPRIRCC